MRLLSPQEMREARQITADLNRGDTLAQADLDKLRIDWEPRIEPPDTSRLEQFAAVRPDGKPSGIAGPRWLFHLFGLRHRAAEVALKTPTGLIVLQRRSPTKDHWPDALDMAVAGHIAQGEDGSDMGFEEGAWREIAEEIGLHKCDADSILVEGKLTRVGDPYFCFEADAACNPPFVDAEVRQIFAATLAAEGLARLHFADGEVAGIVLVSLETAWSVLRTGDIASGLRYSLPRYLDWLEQQRTDTAAETDLQQLQS